MALIVSRYERSKAFYTQILGCRIVAEEYRAARDSWKLDLAVPGGGRLTISGKKAGSTTALCPVGSRLYLAISGETELNWVRI